MYSKESCVSLSACFYPLHLLRTSVTYRTTACVLQTTWGWNWHWHHRLAYYENGSILTTAIKGMLGINRYNEHWGTSLWYNVNIFLFTGLALLFSLPFMLHVLFFYEWEWLINVRFTVKVWLIGFRQTVHLLTHLLRPHCCFCKAAMKKRKVEPALRLRCHYLKTLLPCMHF